MANLTGPERARYVQQMFGRIAQRYDLMNRIMTAGQDVPWRREVIRRAEIPPDGLLLDLGAGTGDLAAEALLQRPACHPVAVDFTMQMMRVGRTHPGALRVEWAAGDALSLPFPSGVFDAAVSGFLLRNVTSVPHVLREQYRLLRPGGRIVVLDTTRPPQNLLSPFINFHLHILIPALGQWLTGDGEAYNYLPESTQNFLEAEQLAARMIAAGFREVGFRRLMFGTIAIHWGNRPYHEPA